MSYWKCSAELYTTAILRAIVKPIHEKDGYMPARESIFFRLLSYCANNIQFEDAKDFSKATGLPIKQCQIVWDICIKQRVLRKARHGFSTEAWMIDYGLMDKPIIEIKAKGSDPEGIPEQGQDCDNSTQDESRSEVETPVVNPNETINRTEYPEPADVMPTRNGSTKFAVRKNVFLSADELSELNRQFNAKQVDMMLDRLNEYKSTSNRYYKSDYQAIKRWVIRWLIDEQKKASSANNSMPLEEFPSWVTGK